MYKDNYCIRQINIFGTFRELWEQHIMWTRSFIMSTALGLGDLQFVAARLLRNPADFANILKLYYGKDNAMQFQKLLEEHLMIAASLVNNAKNNNTPAVQADERKWYQNADEIAAFLAGLNPVWTKEEWRRLLYDHLKMTEQEAGYILTGQYQAGVDIYDQIQDDALKMADLMARGIIKQFHS